MKGKAGLGGTAPSARRAEWWREGETRDEHSSSSLPPSWDVEARVFKRTQRERGTASPRVPSETQTLGVVLDVALRRDASRRKDF